MSIPIIRLEVEGMKRSVLAAFTEYQARFDEDLKRAVDAFCTEENLRVVIAEAVNQHLKKAINEEIERFFRYGAGKDAIVAAVRKHLDETEQYYKKE